MSGPHLQLAWLAVIAYLIGALPFGLIAGKFKGVDIRQHGSHNIGASNAGRVLGQRYFWIVFALDLLKSLVPMALASTIVATEIAPGMRSQSTYWLWIAVGVAAVCGHIFPIYLGFRGGKGVATSAGVIFGLWPFFTLPAIVAVAMFVIVIKITRYISFSSICAATIFPLAYFSIGYIRHWDLFSRTLPLSLVAIGIPMLVILRHRENIGRLRRGTEHKIAARPSADPQDV